MYDDTEKVNLQLKEKLINDTENNNNNGKDVQVLAEKKLSTKYMRNSERRSTKKRTTLNLREYVPISKMELIKMYFGLSMKSITYMLTMLSYYLVESVTLMFLGHSDSTLVNINAAKIGVLYIDIFGIMLFVVGSMRSFEILGEQANRKKDYELLFRIFDQAKIFSILVFLMMMLPICFISNYVLFFIGINPEMALMSSTFIRINIVSVAFTLFYFLNFKFLQILGYHNLLLIINFVGLFLHIICCLCFIYTYNLGIYGAAISLMINSIFLYSTTGYFLYIYNPSNSDDFFSVLGINTDALTSSKFYYYTRLGFSNGMFYYIKDVSFGLIVLAAYYLDTVSLTTNTILYDYVQMLYHIILGVSGQVTGTIFQNILSKDFKKNIVFIKATMLLSLILILIISIFSFLMKSYIAMLYVPNQEVINNFSNIINIYCFIIFFDWSNNILNGILKGLNRHYHMGLISSLSILFFFIPLGLLLAFSFHYGFQGLWYSLFLYMIVFTVIQFIYLYSIDIEKEGPKIFKEISFLDDEEEVIYIR